MKLIFTGIGTRGDFEAMHCVAATARQRGYEVTFGGDLWHAGRFAELGCATEAWCRPTSREELHVHEQAVAKISDPHLRTEYLFQTWIGPRLPSLQEELTAAGRRGDTVIANCLLPALCQYFGTPPAAQLNVLVYMPISPTAQHAVVASGGSLHGCYVEGLLDEAQYFPDVSWNGGPLFEAAQADELPEEIKAFLAPGGPRLCVSLGSTFGFATDVLLACLLGLAETGWRVLVQPGSGRWNQAVRHERLKFVGSISHQLLFAHVDLVIHHGGAGTTAAALGAGVRTICIPHWGDQVLWAAALCERQLSYAAFRHDALAPADFLAATGAAIGDADWGKRVEAVTRSFRRGNPEAVLDRVIATKKTERAHDELC